MVFAEISELDMIHIPGAFLDKSDFCYRFDIRGKFLDQYRFNVLFFYHDITLYPVKFYLDEKIGSELGIKKSGFGYIQQMDSPDNLESFLQAVLRSERVKNVVGSIMRLSK